MTRHNYDHVISFALDHPWAIQKSMLEVIAGILANRMNGEKASQEEVSAALVNRQNLPQPMQGNVAILPVYGVLSPRINLMSEMSGGTSYEKMSGQLAQAMANPNVKTIVLDIDSPGGSVAGAPEFAREVLAARAKKPVIAVANYTMGSAAYWIGASATEIVASPSASVGAVGVFAMHDDLSEAMSKVGVKRTYISAGKYKVEGNSAEPLTAEARGSMQAMVDRAYDRFVDGISKGRGVPVDSVRSGYGQGRTVSADEALSLGMVDKIGTLADTVSRLVGSPTNALSDSSATDTSQEPLQATDQDRVSDAAQRQMLALLDL